MLLEEKDLVERILNDLSSYADIPSFGFLAGGAVANTLMKFQWGGEYPINDLDIFVEENSKYKNTISSVLKEPKQIFTPIRSKDLVYEITGGEGYITTRMNYDNGSTYRILNTERDGIFNYIEISRVGDRDNRYDYEYLLKGFDFNCCQVGIDLRKKQIFYTEEFKNFLETKQLEVTAIYTPSHTAIRLFKKIEELGVYCNVDECMELLSQPLILENYKYSSREKFSTYFGEKYLELYKKHYSNLKEYFTMVGYFDHKKEVWKVRNGSYNISDSSHLVLWLDPKSSIPTPYLERWAQFKGVMWTLVPKKFDKVNPKMDKMLESVEYNPLTVIKSFNFLGNKMKKTQKNKLDLILEHSFYCKNLSLVIDGFFDCDFDVSHLKEIDSFFGDNYDFLSFTYKFNLNLQNTYNFIKTIKRVFNEEGEWVSSLLIEFLKDRNKYLVPKYETIISDLEKYKNKYNVIFCTPFDLDKISLPSSIKVKEVISEIEVQWAGVKLRNCINNTGQMYREKLKSGKTKIFIITTEKSISALELSLNSKGIFEEVQLLSTCNRLPSEYHKNISVILTNEINILNLETQIEKLKDNSTLFTGLLTTVRDESTDKNSSPFGFELPDIRRVIDPEEEIELVDIPPPVIEEYQPIIDRMTRRAEMRVVRR